VYVRNRRVKLLKRSSGSNLVDVGWIAARTRATGDAEVRGTPWLVSVAGREATVNVCGVVVAMRQGHSWAPHLSTGSRVNVGTIPAIPEPASGQLVDGKARRRPMLSGWDGGPVVVRARESRAHGEGVQRVRSIKVDQGDRW
jgi:hypothetical protein